MEQTKPGEALTDCYLRNCLQECEEPIKGVIKGSIPDWIHGCFVRNGPGLMQIGQSKYNHLFDGPAFLQKFAIADGQVTYQNRFVRSVTYNSNMKAQRITMSEFGTFAMQDPCSSLFKRLKAWFIPSAEITDNTCVTIMPYGNEIYALTELPKMNQVDLPTLDVVKQRDLRTNLNLELRTITAHPHVETDGTVYNVGTTMDSSGPAYRVVKIPIVQDGSGAPDFEGTTVVATVKGQHRLKSSYMHSFGMTENYIIFLEQPLYASIPKLAFGAYTGTTFAKALNFEKNSRTRFHIIRKSDGKEIPLIYESHSFMTFHHANAYEQDGCLVVDICCYKDAEIVNALYYENMIKGSENPVEYFSKISSDIRRYVLPLGKPKDKDKNVPLGHTSATAQVTDDDKIFCEPEILYGGGSFVEFPTINYNVHNGKKYKYIYMNETTNDGKQQLVKLDTDTKSTLKWAEPRMVPSEPIMVQHPNAKSEDEGVLLCAVLNADKENCVTLLVLDSQTFQEIGRAEFDLPSAAPASFHGLFFN